MRVVTTTEAAARDAEAIAAGTPSRALMQRAGAAAASEIALRLPRHLRRGVLIFAGPGNNGGDAWVVARSLAAVSVPVRVVEPMNAASPDCIAEKQLAMPNVEIVPTSDDGGASAFRGEGVIVDGLLGTGASGAPRGIIAAAVNAINASRRPGTRVVALDLPSGVDATTGHAEHSVLADLTLSFGTVKRGQLMSRARCGAVVVLDIGLHGSAALEDGAPVLVEARTVRALLPPIPVDAHKGIRKKLVVIGGATGMAGAAVLAARGAFRSGIGMVKLAVHPYSITAVQEAEPLALAGGWPVNDAEVESLVGGWADVVAIGPGLGRSEQAGSLLESVLRTWRGPVLLDADALNHFAGRAAALRPLLSGREALLTPHPAELARLAGVSVEDVLANRFEAGAEVAGITGAAVLLKGTPTVVTAPDGRRLVSATGTPVLAVAGSGDILSGIAATMLAQIGGALEAGAVGAWAHGRAAELASRHVRGATLDDVLLALAAAWPTRPQRPRPPVLAELPRVPGSIRS